MWLVWLSIVKHVCFMYSYNIVRYISRTNLNKWIRMLDDWKINLRSGSSQNWARDSLTTNTDWDNSICLRKFTRRTSPYLWNIPRSIPFLHTNFVKICGKNLGKRWAKTVTSLFPDLRNHCQSISRPVEPSHSLSKNWNGKKDVKIHNNDHSSFRRCRCKTTLPPPLWYWFGAIRD